MFLKGNPDGKNYTFDTGSRDGKNYTFDTGSDSAITT